MLADIQVRPIERGEEARYQALSIDVDGPY
jgi:hypothetical protein